MATPADSMSTQKAFFYLGLIFVGILVLGSALDHFGEMKPTTYPATYPVTSECQDLQRQADGLAQRQNAEDDAATKRELKQLDSLDRKNASDRERRDVATKQDVQDELRDNRQTNEYEAIVQRMKKSGCFTSTEK